MASDQRSDLRYPGGGSSTLDIMTASTTSQSSTLSALATGEHNIGASSSQVRYLHRITYYLFFLLINVF